MSQSKLVSSAVLLLGLLSAGCVFHGGHGKPSYGPCPPHQKKVVISAGHQHTPHCGHVLSGKSWYQVPGHVHTHGCGHVKVGKVWVVK